MSYRGYEIKRYETVGDGRLFYEAWKDGILWAFAIKLDGLKELVDGLIKEDG